MDNLDLENNRSQRTALALASLGFLGAHRFYLGRHWTALLMLMTFGGFIVWWIWDIIQLKKGRLQSRPNPATTVKAETLSVEGNVKHVMPDHNAEFRFERNEKQITESAKKGSATMSKISLAGQTKVSTLKKRFYDEFGLTLRVYDGRSFADESSTISAVRTQGAASFITIKRNMKVGNLEERFKQDFGIKVQIAGSNDSYLCDNSLTLKAALEEDERKLGNTRPTYNKDFKLEVVEAAQKPGTSITDVAEKYNVSVASVSNWCKQLGQNEENTQDDEISPLRQILNEFEEAVDEKEIVTRFLNFETGGISLDDEEYEPGEYKISIVIFCAEEQDELDEDLAEEISDAVQDFLDLKMDLEDRLSAIGIERDALSWWPVVLELE